MSADEERQRQDDRSSSTPTRPIVRRDLTVQTLDSTAAPVTLTPPMHYVDGFSWSPDGREIAYSAAPRSGFSAPYETRIYAVAAQGGAPRTIVDRKGINQGPVFSPDGRQIAFISTNGRTDIMASRSLTVVAAAGGAPRVFVLDDAWVNEFVWSRDSRSIYFQANDGTFGRGEHMFDQPVVALSRSTTGGPSASHRGATVDFSISLSQDGRRMAYKAVEGTHDGRRRRARRREPARDEDHRRQPGACTTSRLAI